MWECECMQFPSRWCSNVYNDLNSFGCETRNNDLTFLIIQIKLFRPVFFGCRSGSISSLESILSLTVFSTALALHSRQLDLKLRLDFLWATQVQNNLAQWLNFGFYVQYFCTRILEVLKVDKGNPITQIIRVLQGFVK